MFVFKLSKNVILLFSVSLILATLNKKKVKSIELLFARQDKHIQMHELNN